MYAGEQFDFEHGCKQFRAFIEFDDDAGAPWEREDGHVDVTEWVSRDKRPSEVIISEDRGSRRFVCMRNAMVKATREGWGLSDEPMQTLSEKLKRKPTKREVTSEAVRLGVERMRAWCNDEWYYVGVCVCLLDSEGEAIGNKYATACWGIESDSDDYLREIARDMAADALREARDMAADALREAQATIARISSVPEV